MAAPQHARAHLHAPMTVGERAADAVVAGMGSWRFILIQAAIVVCWITANAWMLMHPFDAPPFILLNLAFSTQASFAAPLLQLSNNRQAQKDRARDALEAAEVASMFKQSKQLYVINQRQLEILELLHAHKPIVQKRTDDTTPAPSTVAAAPAKRRARKTTTPAV